MRRALLFLLGLPLLALWLGFSAYYALKPGEAAVILRLGVYERTVFEEGPHFHLPWPFETRDIVEAGRELRLEFGDMQAQELRGETAVQTRDNNIVMVEFVVLYTRSKPFNTLYRVRDAETMLREAAQAAMREIVGGATVDDVLRERRAAVRAAAQQRLQVLADAYETGFTITGVELQDVQPPEQVRAAFFDVVNANQDSNRKINQAQGFANEAIPAARAEAAELVAAAQAYRDSKIEKARGETRRFNALLTEYQRAPAITRKRLYLEAMEEILPQVELIVAEKGAAQVLPLLPLGAAARSVTPAPPAPPAAGEAQ